MKKKIVKLTEQDLEKLVKKIIKEDDYDKQELIDNLRLPGKSRIGVPPDNMRIEYLEKWVGKAYEIMESMQERINNLEKNI
tara:strand:+ start:10017 stop:10259 length:243 start_codon:yes stop_codon:yes gene_type:complete